MVSPIRGYDRVENFDTFNVGSGFVRVFWTPWMRERIEESEGLLLVHISSKSVELILLWVCTSLAGVVAVHFCCTSARARQGVGVSNGRVDEMTDTYCGIFCFGGNKT